MFNPEIKNNELPNVNAVESLMQLSPEELKTKLVQILVSKIDTGEFSDIQEIKLNDGKIITVDFYLREHKFANTQNPMIAVQVENGPESFETTWDKLDSQDREEILRSII